MEEIIIVKIINREKYNNNIFVKEYGVLQQKMNETAIINFDGNMGGICVNIAHDDYVIVSSHEWKTIDGRVIVSEHDKCIDTDLRIWR